MNEKQKKADRLKKEKFLNRIMLGRWRYVKEILYDDIDTVRRMVSTYLWRMKPFNYAYSSIGYKDNTTRPLSYDEKKLIIDLNELPDNKKFYIENEFMVRSAFLLEDHTNVQEYYFADLTRGVIREWDKNYIGNLPLAVEPGGKKKLPAGYPDLYVKLHTPNIGLFFELKGLGGYISKGQFDWRNKVLDKGYEHYFACTLECIASKLSPTRWRAHSVTAASGPT